MWAYMNAFPFVFEARSCGVASTAFILFVMCVSMQINWGEVGQNPLID
jgi:hypothetical protein